MTHRSEDRRSGKPLSETLETEAERLAADRSADAIGVIRIKTDDALRELINSKGVRPLESQDTSLVAGNVTGGGGKATRTKT